MESNSRGIHDLIAQYVAIKGRRTEIVSLAHAKKAIRQFDGLAILSDEELDQLIARAAIKAGLPVAFDNHRVEGPLTQLPGG